MLKRLCFVTVLVLAALVGLLGMEVRADIVVNEVMNNPTDNARDEYIELYNTGLGAVDVANWTFSDGTSSDTIVAGNIRFAPGNDTGVAGYDTTTTNIPAGGYAVILDPQYVAGTTPYNFLAGTIILTIETSVTLGTHSLGTTEIITLSDSVGTSVSTYGGYASLPTANQSVERRNPTVDDVLCNWTDGSDSSPGAQNVAYAAGFSLPTADAGSNQQIDSGSSVPIGGSPTASGETGPYTYLWTPDGGTLSDSTNSNPTASPSSTTNYTVTVTDSNGCTATDQVTVTVLPPLTNQTGVSLFGPGTMGVWQDSRNGNWDIYVRDLGPDETFNTGDDVGDSPITTNNKHQQEPDVWVSLADTALIVWTDFRHSADTQAQPYGEIYYATYDKTTGVAGETRVTNDLFYQSEPAVYENTIVYTDNKSGGNGEDLYYHDRGTGLNTLLNAASGPGNQSNADIYGNTVAYQDNVSGNEDIYAVNITTAVKTTIFSGAGRQTNPAIDSFDGRYVAYQSNASGNWDIFVYDFVMGTTTSVAATAANEEYPSIHRGRVAFQREDNLFVYYINGGATYQVTNNAGTVESVKPSIYGPIVGCQERPDQYTLYERNFYTLPDPYGDTPPGVPTGVLESSSCVTVDRDYICSDTFQVHWTAPGDTSPSGFSHYVVEESIDSAAWTNLGTTTATCYPCTGRLHSKFYKYRVKAVSNSGTESAPTASNGITVDSDLPDSPGQPVEGDLVCNSGPDQTYDDNGTYRVSWDAATDAESGIASYELQEDTGALNWQTVATITAPTTCQIINGKSHGVTYYYRVRAINNAGCDSGPWSTTSSGITVDTSPVTAPSNVIEGDLACSDSSDSNYDLDGNYKVKWNAAASTSGIVAYRILESDNGAVHAPLTSAHPGDSTCYSVTGRQDGHTYTYQVQAKNGIGIWSSSSVTSTGITIDSSPPLCPTNVSLNGGDTTSDTTALSATWDVVVDSAPVVGYEYAIGTDTGCTTVVDWTPNTDTDVTVAGLPLSNGVTYYFSVRAKNELGSLSTGCCNDADSITIYLNDWTIVFGASGSPFGSCTAGINDNGHDTFDFGLDVPYPNDFPTTGDIVIPYFPHPTYPDTTTRKLITDIRERTVPLELFQESWNICIYTTMKNHLIEVNKPDLIGVPLALDVMIINDTGEVVYIQLGGVDQGATDPIFTYTTGDPPQETCFTLMVAGQDAVPDTPDWIAEHREFCPVNGQDDDYDTDGTFYVAWGDSEPGITYDLAQSTDGGANWTTIVYDTPNTCYTEANGVDGVTYEHRVRAIDNIGLASGWTTAAIIMVDTQDPPTPDTPTTTPSGYSIDGDYAVCWPPATDPMPGSGVCQYSIEESFNGAAWGQTGDTTTNTCRYFTGRLDGDYLYRVRAIDCAGNQSDYSDTSDTLTVDSTAPAVPANVKKGDNVCTGGADRNWDADGSYDVTWDPPAGGAAVYELREGKAGVVGWTTISDTISDTCHSISKDTGTYYYRVRAKKDAAGIWGTFSAASNGITVGDTTNCHTFGTGWSLISIPIRPMFTDPEISFPGLGSGTAWLLGYEVGVGYDQDPSLALGKGYWLGLNASENICFRGAPLLLSPSDSYAIPLKAGWNLIGCPYIIERADFRIRRPGLGEMTLGNAVVAGWIPLANFYGYDRSAGKYVPTDKMTPYEGYWFGSIHNDAELLVRGISEPSAPAFPSPSLVKQGELLLEITASSGKITVVCGVGLTSSSDDDLDPQDQLLPPDPEGDYISFYTNHPEAGDFSRFSRDVRRSPGLRQTKEFEFVVATNLTGEMTLSWDPSQIKGYRAVLTDGARKIDMKRASSYSYNSGGGQKTFKVELTEKESAPSQNTLLQNFPNPFNPECWIPFKLSEPADHVEFRIYTITGQLIRTIDCGPRDDSDHVKKCGNNESNKENGCACYWDGYNTKGQEVASGVYFYQLVADGKALTKKMVVLK